MPDLTEFRPVTEAFAFTMKISLIILILATLVGCASNRVEGGSSYVGLNKLDELNGEYKNLSRQPIGGKYIFLSQLVWPEQKDLTFEQHKGIESILLKAGKGTIEATAYKNNEVMQHSIVTHMSKIDDGVLRLHSMSSANPGLGVVVGLRDAELFIFQDCDLNLVLARNVVQTGLVFLLIPAMFEYNDTATFIRESKVNMLSKRDAVNCAPS